jgi:hypothetical protein
VNDYRDKTRWLRSISSADPLVQTLYKTGLIDLKLAAKMGRADAKASRALAAIKTIHRNGDS